MNSRGPIENLICKMYDFIELWGLWHPIGILNGVFKITNLLKSRVPSVNISSKASSLGTESELIHSSPDSGTACFPFFGNWQWSPRY